MLVVRLFLLVFSGCSRVCVSVCPSRVYLTNEAPLFFLVLLPSSLVFRWSRSGRKNAQQRNKKDEEKEAPQTKIHRLREEEDE